MLSIRITAAVAAIAVALAMGGAAAQAATYDRPGQSPVLLAGLRPPHAAKTHDAAKAHDAAKTLGHQKTADRTIKKIASRKSGAKATTRLAGQNHNKLAARRPEEPKTEPELIAPIALPANIPDAAPPAAVAAAAPLPASPVDAITPNALVIKGQTVQVAAPDQVNDIDLAANDHDAAAATSDRADAAPVARVVYAAPAAADAPQNANAVGSASWIAQVLAALGGAVAAASVAWFLIGSGPVRNYG